MRRSMLTVAACLFAVASFAQQVPDPESVGHTTDGFPPGVADPCLAHGDATDTSVSDPFLNALKNRDVAPTSFKTMTVEQVVANTASAATAAGKKRRSKWTAAQRNSIAAREDTGIAVVGYLAGVKQECPESCNCHDSELVDFHMWLVDDPDEKRSDSMVVEISPRMLKDHPHWAALANAAYKQGFHVRISGWRTWDQEHPEQLEDRTDKNGTVTHATRATLWEIHPIHQIEVETEDGDFVPIEDADITENTHIQKASCKKD